MKAARLAALGAAIVFGVSVSAHAQPAARGADRVAARTGARTGARHAGPRPAGRALMKGITLTDGQKQQVKQLHEKYAGQRRTLVQQLRPAGTTAGQRVRPDSAQRVAFRTQTRALMEQQMADVRGILTADQRKTFDANVASVRERAKTHQGKHARRAA